MTVMEGSLSKWTNVMKGWQYRWFVLDDNSGLLTYYTNAWDSHRPPPTIKDFDNKVSEADAYLQLMIDQTKLLEDRIEDMTDIDEKTKCEVILQHAKAMLNNIKHTIVHLQIAKNTAHPINGIYQPPCSLSSTLHSGSIIESDIQQGIELGSECIENARRLGVQPPGSLIVPAMSYSSSEGEDDFFDANDSPFSAASQLQTPSSLRSFECDQIAHSSTAAPNASISSAISRKTGTQGTHDSSKATHSIDYDQLYDDEDESDVEMETQGSVIRHLLAQVKIGMDLTKVVLPTFILERRSLLEMYADYFAHPDIFVRIADMKDERERMVQVVKWYLSSFHASRKSSVAKKPYNPILGEVFKCHYDLENETVSEGNLVEDGPIAWCKTSQLSFVAEQVSHHPPTFYAEHYEKRIQFNAYVYTKSKFLGLSVCVCNIGKGIVSVLDHNEDYELTFPNGYGRSILTVPWIELGGPVTIACAKTGYHCNIEFVTKPFYGNKKHRITAEIFAPEDSKRPFATITGEWNAVLEARFGEREEVFVDVAQLAVNKKRVRPIAQQAENESRRLWKEVTAGLKFNDIERATNAKQALEQKQRDEAKERKESGVEWPNVLFSKVGEDAWFYCQPLKDRLQGTSNTADVTSYE